MERRAATVRMDRLDRAKEAIARRIRPVCAHISEAEFDELVERMATIEIKYSMRSERWLDQ